MKTSSMRPHRRKACPCTPDMFDWARERALRTTPAVRAITRRIGLSPALALVIAEHAGLLREAQGD